VQALTKRTYGNEETDQGKEAIAGHGQAIQTVEWERGLRVDFLVRVRGGETGCFSQKRLEHGNVVNWAEREIERKERQLGRKEITNGSWGEGKGEKKKKKGG